MARHFAFAIALLIVGCAPRTEAPAAQDPAPDVATAPDRGLRKVSGFVNRVWKVAAPSTTVEPGQLYAFLEEGTLVVASAHGTPSFGKWKDEAGVLTMVEESIPYTVDVLELTNDRFRIRIHNPGTPTELTLVPADNPPRAN